MMCINDNFDIFYCQRDNTSMGSNSFFSVKSIVVSQPPDVMVNNDRQEQG